MAPCFASYPRYKVLSLSGSKKNPHLLARADVQATARGRDMVSGLAASARFGVGVMLVVVMAVSLLQPACAVQASQISISCRARDDQVILKTSLSRVTDELALRVVVLPRHARRQGRRGFYPQQWATVVPGTSGKCGASSVSRAKSYFQNRGMD